MILGLFFLDPSIMEGRRQDGRTEFLNPRYRMEFACPTCGELNATCFPDVPCSKRKCCHECARLDERLVNISHNDNEQAKTIKEMWKHIDSFHRRLKPKSHIGNGAPMGQFAFTLTMSPNDNLSEEQMITAVRKLMAQRSCPVKSFAWYLEYGQPDTKTHPHIHGMYETESRGRIERKHFKRAWPIWDETIRMGAGFRGGYHRPVRDNESYAEYIKKQDGVSDKFGVE